MAGRLASRLPAVHLEGAGEQNDWRTFSFNLFFNHYIRKFSSPHGFLVPSSGDFLPKSVAHPSPTNQHTLAETLMFYWPNWSPSTRIKGHRCF